MKIIITGGSGFIGQALIRSLFQDGHDVAAFSRNPEKSAESTGIPIRWVVWDLNTDDWYPELDGIDAVIHLAGANISAGRWTKKRKHQILESRVRSGIQLVKAIRSAQRKPMLFIQASAIGYYGDRDNEILSENTTAGSGFLAGVCRQWEASSAGLEELGVRRVILRTGLVLGHDGGLLTRMCSLVRAYLGGIPGNGRQWLSWVHINDYIRAVRLILNEASMRGPVNLVAPQAVMMRPLIQGIGHCLKRPVVWPLPGFLLKMVLGQMADELLLSSQRVIPERLSIAGFKFDFPHIDQALQDLLTNLA